MSGFREGAAGKSWVLVLWAELFLGFAENDSCDVPERQRGDYKKCCGLPRGNYGYFMLFPSLRALMSVPVWISEYSFAAVVAFVFFAVETKDQSEDSLWPE